MATIHLKYEGDLQFEATHESSKVAVKTDAPVDNQGQGRSFSPTDMTATSLGACMGTIMGIIAKRDNIDLNGMTITVQKEMTSKPVRRIGKLTVEIKVPNSITDPDKKKLQIAAETCPVAKSLHPDTVIDAKFIWGQ